MHGDILVTLLPDGGNTKIHMKATANMDNLFALVRSPTKEIIGKFKAGLAYMIYRAWEKGGARSDAKKPSRRWTGWLF